MLSFYPCFSSFFACLSHGPGDCATSFLGAPTSVNENPKSCGFPGASDTRVAVLHETALRLAGPLQEQQGTSVGGGKRRRGRCPQEGEKGRVFPGGLTFKHTPLKNESGVLLRGGVRGVSVAFLWVPAISYLAPRRLAFYLLLKIASYTLQFNVFRLMVKGLAWGDLPKKKHKRKRGKRARTKHG